MVGLDQFLHLKGVMLTGTNPTIMEITSLSFHYIPESSNRTHISHLHFRKLWWFYNMD